MMITIDMERGLDQPGSFLHKNANTSANNHSALIPSCVAGVMGREAKDFYTLDLRESVTSTNTLVKEASDSFRGEGLVIGATHQSAGRGRLGRTFHSPQGSGLYFSVLLRPRSDIADAVFITTTAAVAMCRAINEAFDADVKIKWVNDLYKGSKKVCGILTEGVWTEDGKSLSAVVLGIGVNICPPRQGFPRDIAQIADAVFAQTDECGTNEKASVLLGAFLDIFLTLYKHTPQEQIAELYRSMNLTVGKRITVIKGGSEKPRQAVALDIDSRCRLKVQYTDTLETELLSSGEISIRHGEQND